MNETIPTKEDIIERANTTTSRLEMTLKKYQRYSSISNLTRIILSSSIPVLVSMSSHNIKLLIFVSLAGALLSIIQGVDSFYDLSNKMSDIKQTILFINKETLLLSSNNDPYDAEQDEENVQKFIANLAGALDDELSNIDN
ncbi:hypothetical protein WVIC16_60040 [Weissella viridescens]|nr:DUF4231 domain-containing protein [Weissella viridescens]MBX4173429.1 DUF4231 domain-containing protein [Weissella viridescens]MCB6840694.1 DUF4231 domain-containing protein [Weissella viridescens]MCB6847427.1 DUF4231 domain-containing protein [Weissella viridescens]QOD85865.1 DUF4231 domain-containing protein [Weissella viridescens]WJI90983.1 DUF4231 domain-containing protein [Weissella viridescens]